MDLFEENLTVDEKLILFNTIKRALNSMSKHSTGYHYDLRMVKSEKFQALEKVLCLLAEQLNKDCLNPELVKGGVKDDSIEENLISDAQTIKSVISGFVSGTMFIDKVPNKILV